MVMVVMLTDVQDAVQGAVQGMRWCYELKRMEEAAAQAGICMSHTIVVSVASHPAITDMESYTWYSRTGLFQAAIRGREFVT
jgi:hypothetical protein